MPKLNTSNAASHISFPGFMDMYGSQFGDWDVSFQACLTDMDQAPFYQGGKDDRCQAHHVGYVLKGKFGIRNADGSEEVFEAGDAFVIEPGHTPFMYDGGEFIAFTPLKEAQEQTTVVTPNILKYAQEHDIELPAELMAQLSGSATPSA